MADNIRTPDKSGNYDISQTPPADQTGDSQPWNKSRVEIEPAPLQGPQESPQSKGRFKDRIKIAPMDEQGRPNPSAMKGWREGQKKA